MFKGKKQKKTESEKQATHFSQAIDYEDERISFQKKSQKIAWTIAAISVALLVLSWVGLFMLLPLKENTPFVIRVDKNGIPDVQTALNDTTLDSDEALDKYFVNMYVNIREGYTYQTIQKTYDLTQLYSADQVAEQFRDEYNQPDSLDNVLKKGTAVPKVQSINLEKIDENNLATIRFEVTYTNEEGSKTVKHYSARLAYKYNPKLKLNLSNRTDNPIGFIVTAYQKTEESL